MRGKGIQLNSDYGLVIKPQRDFNGQIRRGLVIGDTLRQNQALILAFRPGEVKLSPVLGVGIEDILLDNDLLSWRRSIRQQLELDGQIVKSVKFTAQKLLIDAAYSNG